MTCHCGHNPCRPGQRNCHACHARAEKRYRAARLDRLRAEAAREAEKKYRGHRASIERITKIYALIRKGNLRVTGTTMAAMFGVSTKTIHRDLAFLRDRLALPIQWNEEQRRWTVDPAARLPWWIVDSSL